MMQTLPLSCNEVGGTLDRNHAPSPCFSSQLLARQILPRSCCRAVQVERGLGDDQSPRGMWGDLDPWLASLWVSLLQLRPLPKGAAVDDTPRLEAPLFTMTPVRATAATHECPLSTRSLRHWNRKSPVAEEPSGIPLPRRVARVTVVESPVWLVYLSTAG